MADPIRRETLHTANELRRATTRLARQLRRLRAGHGISAARLSVLGHLHRAGRAITAVDLARLENLQPQSLTRIIAELDEKGLVSRRQDASDRRQMLIEITPDGSALLVRDAQQQTTWLAEAIDTHLNGTEQALLHLAIGLIDRLGEA